MNIALKRSTATLAVFLGLFLFAPPSISSAATSVNLASASSFGVLGSTGVSNLGTTTISGTEGALIGASGTTAVATGFPVGTVVHNGDALAVNAQTDAATAVASALAQTATAHTFVPGESVGPGVYSLGTAAMLNTSLTLNGGGDSSSIFIFTTPDTFTTGTGSVIYLINGAQATNVFWRVGTTAILGQSSIFAGHLVASSNVSVLPNASVLGSLISQTGNIMLNSNTITNDLTTPASTVILPLPGTTQTSQINSVSPAVCATSGSTAFTVNGIFPTPITNVHVNGTILALTSWVQTPTTVTISTPMVITSPITFALYNGLMPLLATRSFSCVAELVVPPVVVPPVVVPPVVVPPVVVPVVQGTITVITTVENGYGGTATPADFMIALRHDLVDVIGSPALGQASPGLTYTVDPGTYVLQEINNYAFPDYLQSFSIVGSTDQDINLLSGGSVTVVETITQVAPYIEPPVIPSGTLPATGTPWYNLLVLGFLGMALSGVALGFKRKSSI